VIIEQRRKIVDLFEERHRDASLFVVQNDEGFGFFKGVEVEIFEVFELGLWLPLHLNLVIIHSKFRNLKYQFSGADST